MSSGTERRGRRRLIWLAPALAFMLVLAPIVLLAGAGNQCATTSAGAPAGGSSNPSAGGFEETVYGPPWGGIEGGGTTATGINLTAGQPMLEIAVDPGVLALRSYYHVWPNPFGSHGAFLAGDTGGAIIGRHIDTYDWKGRADQSVWGVRYGVSVTKAANPGAGNAIGQVQAPASNLTAIQGQCAQLVSSGVLNLPPGVYANPFHSSRSLTSLRIDMGVDYSGTGPIGAIGNATTTYAQASGTGWGPFSCSGGHGGAVVYRLTDGPDAGRHVYTTEGIIPTVAAGQTVKAGQTVATFTGCIEIGWGSGAGDGTQAVVLGQECGGGQDPGCHSTACGENMSQLIVATGGKPGIPQGPIYGKGC
jgi:3D (Asp-Asp-Asp) domain-containing protein